MVIRRYQKLNFSKQFHQSSSISLRQSLDLFDTICMKKAFASAASEWQCILYLVLVTLSL